MWMGQPEKSHVRQALEEFFITIGGILFTFTEHIRVKDLYEAEVMLSWKLCGFFSAFFQDQLIVKSDSMNVVMWVSSIDLKS